MTIPEEAVEAAAEFMMGAFDGREQYGTDWKYLAEEMLPLVAPPIAAQALRDAADQLEYGNPVAEFLDERADRIEAKS